MATDDSDQEASGYSRISGGARVLWMADNAAEAAELLGGDDADGDD